LALFDYVMLLISVVLSLGLARLLETHARMLKRGKTVHWSAIYLAWFGIMGALHVDLWATLWSVHTNTHWRWTSIMAFFFQAVSLFYGAVLMSPDVTDNEELDLWQFHLENRSRYLPAIIIYTVLGSYLGFTFLPAEQFLPAVYTVGVPLVAACVVAMFAGGRRTQGVVAAVTVVWIGWYFARYLPDFSA